jgi:hypothetical protein
MADANKDQVAELSAKLNALESESQRLLAALSWSSTVRNILLLCLVGFVVVFGWLYYQLIRDFQQKRFDEIVTAFQSRQDELVAPLSQEAAKLVETVGPDVLSAFGTRVEADGNKYIAAFNAEREKLNESLGTQVEAAAHKLYDRLLNDHEKILREEFPQLNDDDQKRLHANMERTYRQIAQRYYIDYFQKEIERMTLAIDQFPMSDPDQAKGPLPQQVLYELMEMIQMMMVGPSEDLKPTAPTARPAATSQSNSANPPNPVVGIASQHP